MNWIAPELSHRMEQLKREHEIDSKLNKLECQEIVLEYFRIYRAWNRAAFTQPHSSIWKYRTHAKGVMERIDSQYTRLERVLSRDPCKGLKAFNKRLMDEIENGC